MTFVYASTSYIQRRRLWQELFSLKPMHAPWLVMGDFNSVLGAHQVRGGNLSPRIACNDFRNMIDDCDLLHMPFQGSNVTWVKVIRALYQRWEQRLDRALCSPTWLQKWPLSICNNFVWFASNHTTLIASVNATSNGSPVAFQFLNIWCDHESFMGLIVHKVVMNKLKVVKQALRVWNKNVFGDVHKAVDEASVVLHDIQASISQHATPQLLHEESVAYANLAAAIFRQENYWKQKSQLW